jgi:NADH:ubiquinone oxidoreductase subunit 3 (subunit A)
LLLVVTIVVLLAVIVGGLKCFLGGAFTPDVAAQAFESGFFVSPSGLPPIRLGFITLILVFLVFDLEILLLVRFVISPPSRALNQALIILFVVGRLFVEV